jgi:Spy/CpxP family protein refolding chaperone
MKKLFSLLLTVTILGLGCLTVPAVTSTTQNNYQSKAQMKKEFEQRLNLTNKQKEKAKLIHQQGREQIKPIMMQIEVKRQEIETVKLTRISEKMQQERIAQLNSEIKELEKQAQEVRKKNSQEFEKILTKKQKAELEKMKAEGRVRFEQNHPPRAPFQGLGTPNFLLRPLLPPPSENSFWK